ncbi:DUF1269 domain-containing protein [Actinocorallia libanotica]|uniref:DUF1269 domain-containing protein n=1 Tax=Actinocorallia libanotica TaxID=46162 RepID=A0ABP4BFX4_9ACTN
MGSLIAIAYPEAATALKMRDRLVGMRRRHLLQVADAAVVEKRRDGTVRLHQVHGADIGASWGLLWGSLIGLLFFVPLLGAALEAGASPAAGALNEQGVDERFVKELGAALRTGGALLFLLLVQQTPEQVLPEIAEYGGEVVSTSLSPLQETHLREAFQAARST